MRRTHLVSRFAAATVLLAVIIIVTVTPSVSAQIKRKVTPVETPATMTKSKNEVLTDTAKINKLRRERSVHYTDDKGHLVYVDTITGERWQDTLALKAGIPKMEYPLVFSVSAGINIWDIAMRAFGQHYGLASAWVTFNMHNRYMPWFEAGLGSADYRPDGRNFTYKSSAAPYLKIGCDYNFFYNSNPDYQLFAGLGYGISFFGFELNDVTLDAPYWDEQVTFNIPRQNVTAGWLEVSAGVRVRLAGNVSAGWRVIFHSSLHESKTTYGKPWYIPGFGTRGSTLTGELSISYTIPLASSAPKHGDDK